MAIATYFRLSKEDLQRDKDKTAQERQRWQLEQRVKRLLNPGEEWLQFADIQSGARDDRKDFQKLLRAINSKQIRMVIVIRIDRITRDLEMNASLAKQFEATGVELFEEMLGRSIDWRNPNDWQYFVNSGVQAESEIRRLSQRIKSTFDWHRSQGKMGGGRVGWPYRRDKDGFIEPNPDEWDKAISAVKIVLELGCSNAALTRIRDELGIDRTRVWLYDWIKSPLSRGHTPQYTREKGANQKVGKRKKVEEWDLVLNTHPSLFDDPELVAIDALRRIDRMIADRKRSKGNRNRAVYPLSGLLVCGRCGNPCHIKKIHDTRYADKTYHYVMCGKRHDRGIPCGGEYGVRKGPSRVINTPYAEVEAAVIDALRKKASSILKIAQADQVRQAKAEPQEQKLLRLEIEKLSSQNDPDLGDAIAKKQARLNRMILDGQDAGFRGINRDQAALMATSEFWKRAKPQNLRDYYHELIGTVEVDKADIIVKLRI